MKQKKVKKSTKKAVKKSTTTRKPVAKKVARRKAEKPIGEVTHFYTAIKVAIIKFKVPVAVGTRLKFKGATTDFEMTLSSMQYNHEPIKRAKKNQQIGAKVPKRVREADQVFKVK